MVELVKQLIAHPLIFAILKLQTTMLSTSLNLEPTFIMSKELPPLHHTPSYCDCLRKPGEKPLYMLFTYINDVKVSRSNDLSDYISQWGSSVGIVTRLRSGHSGVRIPEGKKYFSLLQII
jgi:hypothetical protein